MRQKYYLYPFGVAGDITPDIADPTDPSGTVTYQSGWTFDYQRDLTTDPAAKAVDRISFNAILNDATVNIKQYQENGAPEFITAAQNSGVAFPYRQFAQVLYSAAGTPPFALYLSLIDNNTDLPTVETSWRDLGLATARTRFYCVDTGAANAMVAALPVAPASLAEIIGVPITIKPAAGNTGATTLNLNGLGVKSVVNVDGSALVTGQIVGQSLIIIWNGTTFELVSGGLFVPTGTPGQNDTKIANTAFVAAGLALKAALAGNGGVVFDAATGVSGNNVVNMAQFGHAFDIGGQSVTGYQQLPSGFMEQWGVATVTGGLNAFTFPVTFPNECFSVFCEEWNPSVPTWNAGLPTLYAAANNPGVSSFVVYGQSWNGTAWVIQTGGTFRFRAIGR